MLNISQKIFNRALDKEQYYILRTLKTPNLGRILSRWMLGLGATVVLASFLPWQQNIRGGGSVTAFSPEDRPQTIETAIAGRIARWHIREGQRVSIGDTIITLTEVKEKFFDPQLLQRLQQQVEAKEQSIVAKREKVAALRDQIVALEQTRDAKLEQARNKLQQSKLKLISDSVDFEAQIVQYANITSQYERNQKLFDAGNITLTKMQDIQSKYQQGGMKRISSENKFFASKAEVANARVAISGIAAEYADKISKANSDLNATLSEIYESEGALAKARNEQSNMTIRFEQYQIIAPQNGTIVRTLKAGLGETIKEGEAVATIQPENPNMAIELYVKPMDVPLIEPGRKVRIEFDGWPALQFSGWPSVSVGTFGGEVQVIDYVNSTNGMFRVLVTPDPDDEPWPAQLRFGSGIKGWVMLQNVPIWFEVWRQLNGFPPSLYEDQFVPGGVDTGKSKSSSKSK